MGGILILISDTFLLMVFSFYLFLGLESALFCYFAKIVENAVSDTFLLMVFLKALLLTKIHCFYDYMVLYDLNNKLNSIKYVGLLVFRFSDTFLLMVFSFYLFLVLKSALFCYFLKKRKMQFQTLSC